MSDSSDDMEFYSGFCDDEDEEFVEKEQYDALIAQNKLLVEALEFYANMQHVDRENIARQALSKVKGEG